MEHGATTMPPVPAFYTLPRSVEDIVEHTVWRVLDQFGLADEASYARWEGMRGREKD